MMNITQVTKLSALALTLAAGMITPVARASAYANPDQNTAVAAHQDTPETTTKAIASDTQSPEVKQIQSDVDDQTDDTVSMIRKHAQENAVAALNEIQRAVRALDSGDNIAALDSLEVAIGKLEIVLSSSPSMGFVPIGATEQTTDILASKKVIKGEIKEVQKMIKDGQIQSARELIDTLASETVITESTLPLATFPDPLREAVRMIRTEKSDQAKELLVDTLNTVVVTEHVIPLPILRAQLLLQKADEFAQHDDRSKEDSAHLDKLLDEARSQVEIAELLGYGSHSDFQGIYTELKSIKSRARHNESGKGFFTKINNDLKAMREKMFKHTSDS